MEQERLTLNGAIHVAEGYDVMDTRILDAEKTFLEGLPKIHKDDHEKRSEYYYYLLVLLLKRHITFENPLARNYFERLYSNLYKTEDAYRILLHSCEDVRQRKLVTMQMKAFYKIVDRYCLTLITAYERKGFMDAKERAYLARLNFSIGRFALERKWSKWTILCFFRFTTNFGTSVGRLTLFLLSVISFFALLYGLSDLLSPNHVMIPATGHWFDYVYFSTITLTSLGYGDIVPITVFQKLIVCSEILLGYTILGLIIHLVSKKL